MKTLILILVCADDELKWGEDEEELKGKLSASKLHSIT
jgi:hypothetical protein